MKRAVLLWAAAYGGVRIWFATGHAPDWKLPGGDLLIPDWVAVAGCLVSALAVVAVRSRLLWVLAAGWVAAAGFILLDVVAAVLPGLGIPFDPVGMLSRLGAITGAVLLGLLARTHQQRRSSPWPAWISTTAASLAVAGCLTRLAAQAAVGFDRTPYGGNLSLIVFEGGFVLVGTVLPFLLAHPIGRLFPRWMLLLPGFGIGAGMTAYFGVGLIQMVVATLQGDPIFADINLPGSFFWVAVPAYVVWGAGLTIAARGYQLALLPVQNGGEKVTAAAE